MTDEVKTNSAADMDTSRHTAIRCEHSTTSLRERIERELMSIDSLMWNYATVTQLTGLVLAIMWEHADEICSEYRTIINTMNTNWRKP